MTHEAVLPETRQEPYEIDIRSLFEDPTQMLDFLGEGWQTDSLGLSERSFETQYIKGESGLRFVFFKDRDTRAVRLSASMSTRGRGHSSVSLPNVTILGVFPSPVGFKGMIRAISENRTRVDIRTNRFSRKISMTTASGERADIEL